MVYNSYYESLSDEQKNQIRRNRIALKNMWTSSEDGIEQFLKMAEASKLFDKIDGTDVESIGARNLFVDVCTAMGMFDEEFLRRVLTMLRTFPEIPTK